MQDPCTYNCYSGFTGLCFLKRAQDEDKIVQDMLASQPRISQWIVFMLTNN